MTALIEIPIARGRFLKWKLIFFTRNKNSFEKIFNEFKKKPLRIFQFFSDKIQIIPPVVCKKTGIKCQRCFSDIITRPLEYILKMCCFA